MTKKEIQKVADGIRWEVKVARKEQMLKHFVEVYGVEALLDDLAIHIGRDATKHISFLAEQLSA